MNASQKSEALRLADKYEAHGFLGDHSFAKEQWCSQAAAELRSQHARIAELEAQLSAIGAGGVEPLRKAAPDKSDGWHLVSKSTQKRLAAKWGFVPASALDAEREDAECFRFWVSEAARAPGAMAKLITHCTTEQEYREAILPVARKAREAMQDQRIPVPDYDPQDVAFTARVELPPPLAPDHKGMHMHYKGLLRQVENALVLGEREPMHADFLRQLCGHLKELGERYYAGDMTVVDEFLQLYCIEEEARASLAATHPTQQGLEQFIEQVGDVHFQRCRIGSKEGAIRWDIEFGHYGAEVRGKTLRDAITKALAAQAKQGEK